MPCVLTQSIFNKEVKTHGKHKQISSSWFSSCYRPNEIRNRSEFGVNLGPEATSRANGSVGGEITKRLVSMAEQQLGGK